MTNRQVAQTWIATIVAIFCTALFGEVMGISTEGANTLLSFIALVVQIWGGNKIMEILT